MAEAIVAVIEVTAKYWFELAMLIHGVAWAIETLLNAWREGNE